MKDYLMFRATLVLLTCFCGRVNGDVIAYINDGGGNIDRLEAYGHDITYFNDPIGLTLAQLSGFDTLLVTSNSRFNDPINLGNVIADFSDAGGGVVLTMFSFKGTRQLQGRIATQPYFPLSPDPYDIFTGSSSVAVTDQPNHAIFDGVNIDNLRSEHVATFARPNPGAETLMTWFGGFQAVTIMPRPTSTVVALNFFPGDNFGSYFSVPDNDRWVSNVLRFSNSVVPEPSLLPLAIGCAMFWVRRRR